MTHTVRTSAKNLTCIPTYVGYLAIREFWGKHGNSLILVDRHFCDDGKLFGKQQSKKKKKKNKKKKRKKFPDTNETYKAIITTSFLPRRD